MLEAFGWGVLAASSLALGALVGVFRPWPDRLIGLVLGFGDGAWSARSASSSPADPPGA